MALAYVSSSSAQAMARLRSVALLEQAMGARDINGRELARAARTSAQTVSQLRTGGRLRVRADVARRLEQALRVHRGFIFSIGSDQQGGVAEAVTDLVA
jgi:transcriptional regulator with XRE-family HTH domain